MILIEDCCTYHLQKVNMCPETQHLLYVTYQNLNHLYTGDEGHGRFCFGLGNCIMVTALLDSTHPPPPGHNAVTVQSLSHVRLCNPMDCSTPGFPVSQSLLKLMSIESVMPSNYLIFCQPFSSCLSSSQHQGLFPLVGSCIRWPKYWSFSISSYNEYSGLISFRKYS